MDKVRFKNYLTQLAIEYGTDKYGKHHYTDVYYDIFQNRRETVKKVLEIGSAEGAGIKMFRDFFPNAIIYGADNEKRRVNLLNGWERVEGILCDQSKIEDLNNLIRKIGDVDIIIDDGSHRTSDQLLSILTLITGTQFYIIEDVHEPQLLEELINTLTEYRYNAEVIKCGNRYDDNLIVIKKHE